MYSRTARVVGDRTVGRLGDVKQGSLLRARTVFMLSGVRTRGEAEELSGAEVRASIVAEKSANPDGAKGRRKVDE
jgi:hypothetical protein